VEGLEEVGRHFLVPLEYRGSKVTPLKPAEVDWHPVGTEQVLFPVDLH
jgi:hypothetical protein